MTIERVHLWLQAHPWFKGIEWDRLYQIKAAFIPEVNDELDTQNFEKFEEVDEYIMYCFGMKMIAKGRNICGRLLLLGYM